jgi:hypothetical protein
VSPQSPPEIVYSDDESSESDAAEKNKVEPTKEKVSSQGPPEIVYSDDETSESDPVEEKENHKSEPTEDANKQAVPEVLYSDDESSEGEVEEKAPEAVEKSPESAGTSESPIEVDTKAESAVAPSNTLYTDKEETANDETNSSDDVEWEDFDANALAANTAPVVEAGPSQSEAPPRPIAESNNEPEPISATDTKQEREAADDSDSSDDVDWEDFDANTNPIVETALSQPPDRNLKLKLTTNHQSRQLGITMNQQSRQPRITMNQQSRQPKITMNQQRRQLGRTKR